MALSLFHPKKRRRGHHHGAQDEKMPIFDSSAVARLEQHMRECDARYAQLERRQDAQHADNQRRFELQDHVLEGLRSQGNKILWAAISAAALGLGALISTLIEFLLNHMTLVDMAHH